MCAAGTVTERRKREKGFLGPTGKSAGRPPFNFQVRSVSRVNAQAASGHFVRLDTASMVRLRMWLPADRFCQLHVCSHITQLPDISCKTQNFGYN